jgi:hypothetical protein
MLEGGRHLLEPESTYSQATQERFHKFYICGQKFEHLAVRREIYQDCNGILGYFLGLSIGVHLRA